MYTQPNCPFCDLLKLKLDSWFYRYEVINIQENQKAKMFIKERGHKTVPQLYFHDEMVLNTVDTQHMTLDVLQENIKKYWDNKHKE